MSPRPPGARPGRVAPWIRTHPGMVVALLVPVVVVVGPQLFGWTFVTGDNFLQNLPLRALVGRDLIHGTLPLWNSSLFSGTPLLAGFNAGAAYPLTWLTAVLPLFTAWSITLVVTYDLALVGMYLFLRRQPVGTTAATVGAVTFAFAGYMTGQMVHIDLIGGAAWLPWMLVAVHGLTAARRPDGTLGPVRTRLWALVLAGGLGLGLLTGNSEATIDSAVLLTIYALGRLVTGGLLRRDARRALATAVAGTVAGLVGGVALGAAQWLPGLVFLSHSQRGTATYAFFASGSLNSRLLALVASPFALGTNQSLPGYYAGTYNFPEVTSYAGILALVAACSLFLRRWRTRPESRHWWVWYVVLVVGAASALGGNTPFGHLMYAVPGIRSERLLNRNLLLVDCALAVLAGWFVHGLMADRQAHPPEPSTVRSLWRKGGRAEVVVTALPLVVMAAVALLLWVDGAALQRALTVAAPVRASVRDRMAVLVTVQLAVAAAATWVVLVRRRFTAPGLGRLLGAVLAVDLVLFNVFVIVPPVREAQAVAAGPTSAAFGSLVGNGRFIIYDPYELEDSQLLGLGQTDLNVYTGVASAQGYTALTDGTYYAATGSHAQEDLNPESLAGPVWGQLNVTTLLSLPGYFVTPVASGPGPVAGSGPTVQYPADLASYRARPAPQPDTVTLHGGARRIWYFGGVLTVRSFRLPLLHGSPALRLGLVTPSGGLRWLTPASATVVDTRTTPGGRTVLVTLRRPTPAGGIVVGGPRSSTAVLGVPEAVTDQSGAVDLDGRMQYGVVPPKWTFTGMFGSFSVFRIDRRSGWDRVAGPTGGPAPAGSTVVARPPDRQGGTTVRVHVTGPATLVRSETYAEGWHATVRTVRPASPGSPAGHGTVVGPARAAEVTRDGLVQQVALPGAGDYLVSFNYTPTEAVAGIVVSAAVAVALVVAAGFELVSAGRRRRRTGTGGTAVGAGALGPGGGGSGGQADPSSPTASAARR